MCIRDRLITKLSNNKTRFEQLCLIMIDNDGILSLLHKGVL